MPVHPNGGGWVDHSENVSPTAYVGPNARVIDQARVEGYARVMDDAVIAGHAIVTGRARVCEYACVGDRADVRGHACLMGHAVVGGHASVEGHARVCGQTELRGIAHVGDRMELTDGEWIMPPRYIRGSRDPMYTSAPGIVTIGCLTYPIAYWREHYHDIGRQHYYSEAEIAEYEQYLALDGWDGAQTT